MTYAEELRQHYKMVRERLYGKHTNTVSLPVFIPPPTSSVIPDEEKKKITGLAIDAPPAETISNAVSVADSDLGRLRWHRMLIEIARQHKIPATAICGKSRKHPVVSARHEFWYKLWKDFGWSYLKIGREMNFDHSSVMHGVKIHGARIDNIPGAADKENLGSAPAGPGLPD